MSHVGQGRAGDLAALGVIASMVFVGWEVRQSTTVARAATRNEVVDLMRDITTDSHLADLLAREHNGDP